MATTLDWGFSCNAPAGAFCQEASITVQTCETVKWVARGGHQVVSGIRPNPDGTFASEWLSSGQSFSFKFEEPGEYPFYCPPHANMNAKITVWPA
ncbi:hypothetical protein EMIHUDRAFT_225851 [Emiliania huxleyi CCMP1516]|uniref:Blue (type 1) copper domain-containing protein n=2 Tax=Emiliania huxleyi TaxID=2903 RepID=A0A0D3I298_EMIH1|nr:hypothetical protein EMIHUDRAFT_199072 [Emiliania huxleyi CCMP1516]XP_005789583.1 hypothetical protein EMIHUDRAFT_225851 [Emiliania huxleyi CCMP1516]EOD05383.1 hypothetical protein EMIHUDRAFT_199072 [Emiliania huxleyi CCMP1516]EOD37154.1 hypothetical protein EMIHUDRAFT_225851 [Emiliania huxleyi CCMP1516]|eukprot:XP_005757812.1 hypothetical protein EMIHUDRAFT_199072 [Emiliania huxleyi CCMP1516]